jgi:hypothetical protein
VKLDEVHLKSEIRNLRLDGLEVCGLPSDLNFRISDLKCRMRSASPIGRSLKIRPILKLNSYVD